MNFFELKEKIKQYSINNDTFETVTNQLSDCIYSLSKDSLIDIIDEIGTIPEDIDHDSTEEKLYSKVSDIVLAKAFHELGLKATIFSARADSADVQANSKYHGYSLVGDAKAFRLSRTAKNQKDFKVESMNHWRQSNDYSVLVCPYFQYPKRSSQIYKSALNTNVEIFAWEWLSILLKEGIFETPNLNLSSLWNHSSIIAEHTLVTNQKDCFLAEQEALIRAFINISEKTYNTYFFDFKKKIIHRGENEIQYWKNVIKSIRNYSREKAIEELIAALKLNEKIRSIDRFINTLDR
ncbi:MAG: HindIII family type II restriction endonuclease [Sphaerochaetaceae bacterium]